MPNNSLNNIKFALILRLKYYEWYNSKKGYFDVCTLEF